MKKFLTLVAAAAVAISASAQEKEWNISDFEAATFTSETTINGLTIYATENAAVTIDGNNKTVDGVKYTQRLKTGGAGSLTDGVYSRIISFDVPSNGTVTFIATSSNGSDDRVVGVSFGEFIAFPKEGENPAGLNTLDVVSGDPQVKTVQYDGGVATKVYIYSKSGGVNFYDFKFTPSADAPVADGFEWEPMWLTPSPMYDIMVVDNMANVSFNSYIGESPANDLVPSDVMPIWIDEDGNEIKASSVAQDPWSWGQTDYFTYTFDISEIKANGEYTLLFPEGMLVNAAGQKSAKFERFYTLNDVELAPAMFDDFEVISVTPELSQPQAIWNDQIVTVNTNHNDAIGFTKLVITDVASKESVVNSTNFTASREIGDNSEISWEVAGSYKFFEDHIYRAEFTFYNGKDEYSDMGDPTPIVGKATFDFTGRVEGYKYSSAKLLSVEPAPMSFVITDPSQAVFNYTFSAPVTVYQAETPLGMNGKNVYPPSCLSSNEDKTVWTLDLSDNDYVKTVDAMLTIYVYAKDEEGYQLQGNWGEEGESCFMDEWECELGAFPVEIIVPASEAVIERLTEVVVKSVDGQEMDWAYGSATIQGRDREALGELYYEIDFETPISDQVRFTQWIPAGEWEPQPLDFAKEGVYSIVFRHGCFLAGEQFESKQSHSVSTSFEIKGGGGEQPGVDPAEQETFNFERVEPAAGSTVTSLSKIQLWFPDVVACEEFFPEVYNKADNSLVTTGFGLFSWDDWFEIDIDFSEPVTEAGEYEVVIPARVIYTENFVDGSAGICNPEIRLSYTVDPDGNAVETVSAAAKADVFDIHGRLVLRGASAAAIKALPKGIYVVAGRKLVVK